MNNINYDTAFILFKEKKYLEAGEQFTEFAKCLINPAFSYFMAGKCFEIEGKTDKAIVLYEKALGFDDSNALINREIEQFQISNDLVNPNKKIIYHYFPHTRNIGDSGSAFGIRKMISTVNNDFYYISLSCRKHTIETLLKFKKKEIAGVIIGGGGLYFDQPLKSGWYFPLSLPELKKLNLPVISYAVGLNQEYIEDPAWNTDTSFMKNIAEFNNFFKLKSVRDKWTMDALIKQNVSQLKLVPCASAFLEPLPWYNLSRDTSQPIIGISITDRSLELNQKADFIKSIIDFSKWLLQQNYYPLFVFQDSEDDRELLSSVNDNKLPGIIVNTAREAISIYSKCTAVFGMRGHSLILSTGKNIPVVGISYNRKVDAFMELIGLKDYCINQEDIKSKNNLIILFDKLMINKIEIIEQLKNKNKLFYNYNQNFSREIDAIIK